MAQYSTKGRKGYNPIMLYAVIIYAAMRGVKAVDQIVKFCQRDIAFIWLTKGQKPQQDAFYDFINQKLTDEILDDLHYQFLRRLQKEGLITLVHKYCVYESFDKFGWLFTSFVPVKPKISLNIKMMISVVNNKLQNTFSDRNKQSAPFIK